MAQYGIIMPQAPAHFTHPRLQIRTAQDAHRVFEAVRLGILPLIRRRLSPSERDLLASGQVFVWEEAPTGSAAGDETSQTTSGLERWTDGRRWSQSRMREPFLFYEEKVQTTAEEKQAKADRRARKASSSDSQAASAALLPLRRQDRPSKPDGLTKQTYSSYVQLRPDPPASSPFNATQQQQSQQPTQRKWHCVAYFNAADWNNLPSVDAYVELKNLVIPDGVYTSTKGTGKTGSGGGVALPPYHPDELVMGGGGIGPIRRPMSRGDLNSAPYSTNGAVAYKSRVEGPTSPCSSSSMSDDPRSPGSACDSPISYHAYPSSRGGVATNEYTQQSNPLHHHQHQHQQNGLHPNSHTFPHHQHSSSTSSASTGSPPTPGFMAPIPSPASFTNGGGSGGPGQGQSRAYSHPPPLSGPSHPSLAPARKSTSPLSKLSSSPSPRTPNDDVVMLDAPTLRTPTKDRPQYPHLHQTGSKFPHDNEYFSTSPTSTTGGGGGASATALPSFSSILGQPRSAGPAGRSREDSMALGAFRLTL